MGLVDMFTDLISSLPFAEAQAEAPPAEDAAPVDDAEKEEPEEEQEEEEEAEEEEVEDIKPKLEEGECGFPFYIYSLSLLIRGFFHLRREGLNAVIQLLFLDASR